MKYVIFDGNTVYHNYIYTIRLFAIATARRIAPKRLTVGEVTDDDRILRMWRADGSPMKFESHGGDHGTWV